MSDIWQPDLHPRVHRQFWAQMSSRPWQLTKPKRGINERARWARQLIEQCFGYNGSPKKDKRLTSTALGLESERAFI